MKKTLILMLMATIMLSACHESLEKRAAREANEYTKKFCPTPFVNFTRTDSVVFDIPNKTYHYYCSVNDKMDDAAIIDKNRSNLHEGLIKGIVENTAVKVYKEAKYSFAYTLHSTKNPQQVLYEVTITPKDYEK